MNIVNKRLTLNPDLTRDEVECIAGCRVTLTPLEIASFALGNSFTLSCVLRAADPGTDSDEILFVYSPNRTFSTAVDLLDMEHVFRDKVSRGILDEDVNGSDEIRARFRLMDNSNGRRRTRTSARVQLDE
jgi:hypothetical protein